MKQNLFTILIVLLIAGIFVVSSCAKKADDIEKAMDSKDKNETKPAENSNAKTDESKTEEAELLIVKTCPVMGGEANLEGKFIVYKGYKVYFCCPSCDVEFEKDPEKYIALIKADPKKYIKDSAN